MTNDQYLETMKRAQETWEPEVSALRSALGKDYGVSVTQTGGMCLAIEIELPYGFDRESGTDYTLLVTDMHDSLPWDRDDHVGWCVGAYDSNSDPILDLDDVTYTSFAGDIDALVSLVRNADERTKRIVAGELPNAEQYAKYLWSLIVRDMPARILDQLTNFGDLHDHCDANEFLIEVDQHFDIQPLRNARAMDVVNRATDITTGMIIERNAK